MNTTGGTTRTLTVSKDRRARRLRALILLMVTVAVTTAASSCSSDAPTADEPIVDPTSTDEPVNGRGVVLTDPGSEPTSLLESTNGATFRVLVTATDASSTTLDGTSTDEERSAVYELEGESVSSSSGVSPLTLLTRSTITELSSDQPIPQDIPEWRTSLDRFGIVIVIARGAPGVLTTATSGLLTTPGLRLVVPDKPVGIGATWTYPLGPASDTQISVTVLDITDELVEVTMQFDAENEIGGVTMTAAGSYARSSLIAVDVQVEMKRAFATNVADNGLDVEMAGIDTSIRHYNGGAAT